MNRRQVLLSVPALALVLGSGALAADAIPVRVGVVGAISDVAFFIADEKGYFREEGLSVSFVNFDSGARMVSSLGTGQLDVGGGSASAGLYNAAARGIEIKIVADKGSTPPGYGFQPLLVRKAHVESGRYKGLADLKGMKIAGSAPGSASTSTLNEALERGGLEPSDVERVFLGFSQHVLALQNGVVDAALTTEPSATEAVNRGAAVRVMGDDAIYPDHQLSEVLYAGTFIKAQPDAARRFMRAYLRAVRDYNDALKDGRIAGPNAEEVIAILTKRTAVKDPAVYRAITPQGTNPDGHVNMASLKKDLDYYKEQKEIKGKVEVEQLVDMSFVEAALKDLGPYKPKR